MNLTDQIFTDADAARAHLERLQWANVRAGPHCGTVDNSVELKGKSTRPGVYQHCGEQHLQRYLREFDFRYSHRIANGVNDTHRAEKALAGIVGKRLTYRRIDGLQAA